VKVIADTNILVRAIVVDDHEQAFAAQTLLARASLVSIPVPVLCELVWVLRRGYKSPTEEIIDAITSILESAAVATDRPAVSLGLALLRDGSDFADGAIAAQGVDGGGEVFASFDANAVERLRSRGFQATQPQHLINRTKS
jgi:predicted nucleic-acid-binding protein